MAMQHLDDPLGLTFAALADPTRRAILARLSKGEADVAELTKPFGLSQPTISKHLKVLERAGLVVRGQDAQRRPRALVATPLEEVDRFLEPYRRLWEARFASLDDHLAGMKLASKQSKRPKRRGRTR